MAKFKENKMAIYNSKLSQYLQERKKLEQEIKQKSATRLIYALLCEIDKQQSKQNKSQSSTQNQTSTKRQIKGVKLESDLVDWSKWDDLRF